MLIRDDASPKMRSPISLKATLMTAIIIFFGILHIIGVVLLQNAAPPRPGGTSGMVTSGD